MALISLDFDGTLRSVDGTDRERGHRILRDHQSKGDEVIIVTRRPKDLDSEYEGFTGNDLITYINDNFGDLDIHFTDLAYKWKTLQDLGVTIHYDDDPIERAFIIAKTQTKAVNINQYDPPMSEENTDNTQNQNESLDRVDKMIQEEIATGSADGVVSRSMEQAGVADSDDLQIQTIKKGDRVKDVAPDCPYFGIEGDVITADYGEGEVKIKAVNNTGEILEGDEITLPIENFKILVPAKD